MKFSFWAKSAIALVVVFCLFKIVDLRIQSSSLKNRNEELQKEIDLRNESIEEKENILRTPFTSEVIEEFANEHHGLYRPDVVIFSSDQ